MEEHEAKMSENEMRIAQLTAEKNSLEETHPLSAKLLSDEIDRLHSGTDNFNFIELHHTKTKVEYRVKIPVKEFPQVNFVGKILGQGGENVKRLQEATGVRIAVLGRGSMKDKAKAEALRQQGGKYSHLNHDLHVWFEAVGHPIDCYQRIAHAFQLVHPFLVPDPNELQMMQQQNGGMMRGGRGGQQRGRGMRGGVRGGPMMGRGGPRGGSSGMGGGMGGGMGRGASMLGGDFGGGLESGMGFGASRPPLRGGAARGGRGQMPRGGAPPRGGSAMSRGGAPAMRGRGGSSVPTMVPPPAAQQSYQQEQYDYDTSAAGYGGGYGEEVSASFEDPAAGAGYGTAAADVNDPYQYDAYGATDESAAYSSGYEANWGGDGSGTAAGYGKAQPPSRGGLTNYRTRPY